MRSIRKRERSRLKLKESRFFFSIILSALTVTGLTHRSMQMAHFSDSSNMLALAVPSATGGAAAGALAAGALAFAAAVVASTERATAVVFGLTSPVFGGGGCLFARFFFFSI